ncbi:metallophosphoesterase [Tenacibaculum sp. UWU-22]|uniref:metallophosphoesterase n=1 Tax=Tenacibaculum sp. UWU-22 TaxID=3234187 RepID=UPI0034DAC217
MPRRIIIIFSIIGVLILVSEYYTFQALKIATKFKFLKWAVLFVSVLMYANFFYTVLSMDRGGGQTIQFQWAFAWLLIALVPKLVVFVLLFGEDVVRGVQKGVSFFSANNIPLRGRRKFLSQLALVLSSIPFSGLLYGIIKGRYNYKVIKYNVTFADLPEAFDGFTITHISDIHSGSFTNKNKIQYGVDLINQQKSDVILFTGDVVNNFAKEMDSWITVFKQLEAPMGKFSVLGNHDYGDYSEWKSPEEKAANFQEIKNIHPKIGFDLLLNEHRYLEKDGQKIALIGVENWGKGFNKAGNLQKASQGVAKADFKILMTHDPSHWEYKVKKDDFNYHLSLCGHTHGLQFGIEIPGYIKWSPAQYIYKQWAGLYEHLGRYVNVNRGFGYHAFPGRVGIWPEITVIKLKKA